MNKQELMLEAVSQNQLYDGKVGLQMFTVTEEDLKTLGNTEIVKAYGKLNEDEQAVFLSIVADHTQDAFTDENESYFHDAVIDALMTMRDEGLGDFIAQAKREAKKDKQKTAKQEIKKWERVLGFSLKANGALLENLLKKKREGNLTELDKARLFDAILDANDK